MLFVLRRDVVAEGARLRRQRGHRPGQPPWRSSSFSVSSFWIARAGPGLPAAAPGLGRPGGKTQRARTPGGCTSRVHDLAGAPRDRARGSRVSLRRTSRTAGAAARWRRHDQELALLLADVVEETLDDLRAERDPRKAVIAAYARLERALAAYGLPRRPSEAPEEYVARILGDLESGRHPCSA